MENKKNTYVRITKLLIIILIPLIFLELIFYYNTSPRDFYYFYDIGNEEDNYLSPANRISDKIIEDDLNYRNLKEGLVYFDVPIPKRAEFINVQVRFKDNFPKNSKFSIGARDKEEWHYLYRWIYNDSKKNPLDSNWHIEEKMFDFEEDKLILRNNKLSVLFRAPHLSPTKNQTNTKYIPIDWINITIHKKGWFEK